MGKRKSSEEPRWRRWSEEDARRMLAALRKSRTPVSVFAKKRGITTQRVFWWKKRLRDWERGEGEAAEAESHLVPVNVLPAVDPAPRPLVAIRIGSELAVEVAEPSAVPPQWVSAVVAALRAR